MTQPVELPRWMDVALLPLVNLAISLEVAGVVVTLVEAVGVAAIRQTFQLSQQLQVEGSSRNCIVDRAAIALTGASDVIGAFGAAFNFE